ncbi:MAG: hypothetical protein ACRDLN_04990 [Solirubrobacteraceae bacterium]
MFTKLTTDLMDLQSFTSGSTQAFFAPTAARCSSSSSTCCATCFAAV